MTAGCQIKYLVYDNRPSAFAPLLSANAYIQVSPGAPPAGIFSDGFETGTTNAWSSVSP